MDNTPAITHRAKKNREKRSQGGTIESFTTIHHPPAGFPQKPRRVALILLGDGSRVLGSILGESELKIGQAVAPRMHLQSVQKNGLRTYDFAYAPVGTREVKE